MLSPAAQEYLETVYNITVEGDRVVNARLAEKFGVSAASVTEMLRRLERDGYVALDPATGATLTEQGIAAAEAELRRHRLAERFLFEVLRMDWIAAHVEAHALQHGLTPAIEAQMVAVLGNPTTCPHGNPIPGSAPATLDFLRTHDAIRLSDAPEAAPLRVLCISEVVEDETALLRSMSDKDLRPGTDVIVRRADDSGDGALRLDVAGRAVTLERTGASKIWVYRPHLAGGAG
jgi:DtxR family transcriptional regulator, Mn-dependent transcriptional regulator